ncbi:hypothetical protein P4C99_05185 [Pontiellaceae bacterium B1224]|nr:hypothetical protein [Pontiellaceae bacterium B1224]
MKKMAMLLAAGCAIGMLTGCGIPEEEHLAIIDGINAQHQEEVDLLNIAIADRDDVIKSEKAKARQTRIELDDASERIEKLNQKSLEISKALAAEKSQVATLESQLQTAQTQAAVAMEEALESENKYSTLDVEYQDLKRRFEMFKKNMSALSAPKAAAAPAAAPSATPAAAASTSSAQGSASQKASSLLDEMGSL